MQNLLIRNKIEDYAKCKAVLDDFAANRKPSEERSYQIFNMAPSEQAAFGVGRRIGRRHFLQMAAGGLAWLITGMRPVFASSYRVGVGKMAIPYAATIRAVEATGEWPSTAIFGKTVVIKPNLVVPMTDDTGVTTDPEVVRALVDLALQDGATQVCIIEGGFDRANFLACGYGFFDRYDPRVRLIHLNDEPLILSNVPYGMAYHQIYMPQLLLTDDVVFISAAKLKTHFHTNASLTMKNLVGLAPIEMYNHPGNRERLALHLRGISQVIVDLNLVSPIDFAVVDGIWAMEGEGPTFGDPVRMDMVLAGRNPVAVDRVCLLATRIPQHDVRHLTYAASRGLGPTSLDEIEVVGDPFTPRQFRLPNNPPPIVEYPRAFPHLFAPSAGQTVKIIYWVSLSCLTRVEIVYTSDLLPEVVPIRMLHDWERRPSGFEVLKWDGRDDNGRVVPPGRYTMRVQAIYNLFGAIAYATGWVWVTGS